MQNRSTRAPEPAEESPLAEALDHLRSALELLDQGRAPGEIAGYVDLAIYRLEEALVVE